MNTAHPTPFGKYVTEERKRQGLSQNDLARKAGIDSGNLSKVLRGLLPVTHMMAESIADALRVDANELKAIAGLRTVVPPKKRDPHVEYLAQELNDLPEPFRSKVLRAIEDQLGNLYKISGYSLVREAQLFIRDLKKQLPYLYFEVFTDVDESLGRSVLDIVARATKSRGSIIGGYRINVDSELKTFSGRYEQVMKVKDFFEQHLNSDEAVFYPKELREELRHEINVHKFPEDPNWRA